MDDTKLAPFAAEGFPTFEDAQKAIPPATASEVAPSRRTRSRRSRRGIAAPTRPSRAEASSAPKTGKEATAQKRKYTRRAATPVTQAAGATAPHPVKTADQDASELEIVVEIVARLRALDAKTRARVTAAIGRLL